MDVSVSPLMAMSSNNHSVEEDMSDSEETYDSEGAMKYIVVTLLTYALLGILSLLLVRIVRRAKLRHKQLRHEEIHIVRRYLRELPRLQMEGCRQKLMHHKIRTAVTLWKTDNPAFNQYLLTFPRSLHPPHTTSPTPHHTTSPTLHHTTSSTPHHPAGSSVNQPRQLDRTEEEGLDHAGRTRQDQLNHPESFQHRQKLGNDDTTDQRRPQNAPLSAARGESETIQKVQRLSLSF